MNAALRSGIVIACLIVLWRAVEVNVVLYDDAGRPAAPAARAGGSDLPEREVLMQLVRENPANAAAYAMLARDFEAAGDTAAATRAFRSARRVAPVDHDVLAAMADHLLRHGEVAPALDVLAVLVESYSDVRDRAFAVMARTLASGQYAAQWNAILARSPPWLGAFIESACRGGLEATALAPIYLQRVAAGQASSAEGACIVERLRESGRWDQAYQLWLNTLPRERLADVGFVFNGSFEYAPLPGGFDWIVDRRTMREAGHTADFARAQGVAGQRALRVVYSPDKRQAGVPVAQFLALAPGRYQVTGMAREEGMKDGHGAQWTLRCVVEGKPQDPFAQSVRFTGSGDWEAFSFDATVAPGCTGQLLQLEPAVTGSASAFLAGTLWFDNLAARQYH
ncbi:MAG TPA: hypothetical protein VLT89_12820 [Usitatibacter sp.]|nr:hypothetical protein [Usitatibacter sp.]